MTLSATLAMTPLALTVIASWWWLVAGLLGEARKRRPPRPDDPRTRRVS